LYIFCISPSHLSHLSFAAPPRSYHQTVYTASAVTYHIRAHDPHAAAPADAPRARLAAAVRAQRDAAIDRVHKVNALWGQKHYVIFLLTK
jgi:hypothetical protein